jgi:hypothetical protein
MLDALASRYHCLPSQALETANSFDVFILNRVLEYQDRKRNPDKYLNKATNSDYSPEELMAIMQANKGKK